MNKITDIEKMVANITLKACEIREMSYDKAAADLASETRQREDDAWAATNPDKPHFSIGVDYKKFYALSLEEACHNAAEEAGNAGLAGIVYLALDGWWNDAISWARRILDPTAICVPTIYMCQHGKSYIANSSDEEFCPLCTAFFKELEKPTSWMVDK